jgi:hypothetical protein
VLRHRVQVDLALGLLDLLLLADLGIKDTEWIVPIIDYAGLVAMLLVVWCMGTILARIFNTLIARKGRIAVWVDCLSIAILAEEDLVILVKPILA